ncbi:hypothetical protein BVRB_7g167320 [Beta vulgaris subsp. vulgaris]|nr:hypothetical protein BVRB_7g167320 [Beta vulgaris subsp. vulgaris]
MGEIMGEMKVTKCVGSKIFLLLIITIMAGTCAAEAATGEYPGQSQELQRISNILLEAGGGGGRGGVIDDNLTCLAEYSGCMLLPGWPKCCPGTLCQDKSHVSYWGLCLWCPGRGETCGALHPCCDGFRCTGFFSGQCVSS